MRIRITTTFTDLQATDPEKAEVPALTEMTVTAERGAQLVSLGIAEEIESKPTAKKRRARKQAASTQASIAAAEPADTTGSSEPDAATSSDADQAPTT